MDRILVTIMPKDFKESNKFSCPFECPLAMALKRMFPDEEISVGSSSIHIGSKVYVIPSEWGWGKYSPTVIDNLIKGSRESLDQIPTVSLTLESYQVGKIFNS